jgi:hypothetical protein
MGTSSGWTAERRARQSERIRRVKPWEKSTGPKTMNGKQMSSQNARKYSEVISPQFEVMMRVAAHGKRLAPGWSASPSLMRAERAVSIEDALEIVRSLQIPKED